ncbi:uncharacterized protein LOC115413174 isoform X2 [Sphaeramia orbicularis]|uniref:uncharacterized protein LOC115413174 isoform X2 n=1 Tax=Sphaeramia orbicularis TaxID=375764 RepID=UPI0011807FAE|nr:uncharacterized protein LOC115413174 isoform X2 [Sphaeramia orbicularis]
MQLGGGTCTQLRVHPTEGSCLSELQCFLRASFWGQRSNKHNRDLWFFHMLCFPDAGAAECDSAGTKTTRECLDGALKLVSNHSRTPGHTKDLLDFLKPLKDHLQSKGTCSEVKVYTVVTGKTHGADRDILEQVTSLQSLKVDKVSNPQDCDVGIIFCPIVSRMGSDVEAAMRRIPECLGQKPVILVLMHHLRKEDHVTEETDWSHLYPNVKKEIHILFHETMNGLLRCKRNDEAIQKLRDQCKRYVKRESEIKELKKQLSSSPPAPDETYHTGGGSKRLCPTPSHGPDGPSPGTCSEVKVYTVVTGKTHGADRDILEQVTSLQSLKVDMVSNPQDCDVVVIFCPIVSRVGSDVEAAMRRIPECLGQKPVILVLMHHLRKEDNSIEETDWSHLYPNVKKEIHILFHETMNGLLRCKRNDEAIQKLYDQCKRYAKRGKHPTPSGNQKNSLIQSIYSYVKRK